MIKYGDLNLQDDVIITERIEFRSMADRVINLAEISRRPGVKFLSDEFGSKLVTLTGKIKSPTASGLIGIVDNIHKELSKTEQALTVVEGRSYTATTRKVDITDQRFSQSLVPFTFEFLTSSPFTTGNSVSVGFTLPSGTLTQSIETSISGSVFAEPLVTLTTHSGAGPSGLSVAQMLHNQTGDAVTVSGSFSRSVDVVLNYETAVVTVSGLITDYTGKFSRLEPGTNSFDLSLEGSNDLGVTGEISYQPRFYQ